MLVLCNHLCYTMGKYISVEIPTKSYIKAYLLSELGERPFMTPGNRIGSKLIDLLAHQTNDRRTAYATGRYDVYMKIYISYRTFHHRGANLNETNISNFNKFVEDEIKARYRTLMDFYIDTFPSFEANLPRVRKHIGIDADAWQNDSIKKDYYRYRKRTGKQLLYKTCQKRPANLQLLCGPLY